MEENIGMNKDIISVLVGFFITIISVLTGKLADVLINKKGKIHIYRKFVYEKGTHNKPTRIYSCGDDEKRLMVAMWIEIHNTKKMAIVIRDFGLFLYKDGKQIKKMKQIQAFPEDSKTPCGDDGNYSFLVKSEYIVRYKLLYSLKQSDCNSEFDEIRIVYYDHKSRKVNKPLMKVPSSWTIGEFGVDEEWTEV